MILAKILINKSIKETNRITYNKSFIKVSEGKKDLKELSGGEAIYLLLRKILLQETCVPQPYLYSNKADKSNFYAII